MLASGALSRNTVRSRDGSGTATNSEKTAEENQIILHTKIGKVSVHTSKLSCIFNRSQMTIKIGNSNCGWLQKIGNMNGQ